MAQHTAEAPAAAGLEELPPDIATMRATVRRLLGPDDGPEALPPSPGEAETLTLTVRGHLELLILEVERAVGPRPRNVPHYCALACVGEARRKLGITPRPGLESGVAHARRLARCLSALCDHHERLGGRP